MSETWTSLRRVLTTLGHREPDRVPLLLPVTLHGAKLLGLSLRDYFAKPEHVTEGQLRLRARYGHDFLIGFYFAPLEVAAWGGEVVFYDDGPPNSGEPPLRRLEAIDRLAPPRVAEAPGLQRVLETIRQLRARAGAEVPIGGVVISPFSLPVMQLGFERYLTLLHEQPARFERLMALNEAFTVEWANAQLAAGATALIYFDPVSSNTIIPPELYRRTGHAVARRTLARFNGPAVTSFASGRCLPILDDVLATGSAAVHVSAQEDLTAIKAHCRGRATVAGNLNALEMRRWTPEEAEAHVMAAIAAAGPGGGFILADNHGEIPWQVPDETLLAVAEAARRWGTYPLEWAAVRETAHG